MRPFRVAEALLHIAEGYLIEQHIFPQRVLDLRQIRIFEEEYLEAVSSRRSASPHSRRLFVERFIFP